MEEQPTTASVTPRQSVEWFARWMELKLRQNDHKSGWQDCRFDELFQGLDEEMDELRRAEHPVQLDTRAENLSPEDARKLISECADIANFAMMIADNVRHKI